MATTINKCPLCGGTISVYANVETRLTLYDGEAQAYELTTGQDDIIRQIKRKLGISRKCRCNDCGDHVFYVRQAKDGKFELSDIPFDDRREALIEYLKQNYPNGYRIYADYNDYIHGEEIRKFLESENPAIAFQDYLDWLYEEQSYNVITEIVERASADGFADLDEIDIRAIVMDEVEIILPEDYYLDQQIRVDIYIDTGDADYDFVSNAMYPHYNGRQELFEEIDEERRHASLFWLAETQGYDAKTFFEALQDDVEHTDSRFITSVFEELYNTPTHMPRLVFLRTFTLRTLLAIAEKDGEDIHIPTDTTCGLYDKWSGGGGPIEIKLEKPLRIPRKIAEILPASSYEYNIMSCYGMLNWAWTTNENPYKKKEGGLI